MLSTTFPQHCFYLTLLPLESTVFHEQLTQAAYLRRRLRFRNLSSLHTTDPEITEHFPRYNEPEMQAPNGQDQGPDEAVDALGRTTSQILHDFWKAREEEAIDGEADISSSEMHDHLQMLGARGPVARKSRGSTGTMVREGMGDGHEGEGIHANVQNDEVTQKSADEEIEGRGDSEGTVNDGKRARFRMAIRRLGGGRLERGKEN